MLIDEPAVVEQPFTPLGVLTERAGLVRPAHGRVA
jgi:hypothetical protein